MMREMLLKEAAVKNPDAASVFSGGAGVVDSEAMQRALLTASSLSVTHAQNAHFLQQQQQHHDPHHPTPQGDHNRRNHHSGNPRQSRPSNNPSSSGGGGGRGNPFAGSGSDKIFYELHVGGLPEIVQDEHAFTQLLNDEALKRGLNLEPGNPITSTRINSAGRFAFAMFRSKEEATRGLELSGTLCHGSLLRVERPRGFKALAAGGGNSSTPPMDEAQLVTTVLNSTPVPSLPGMTREQLKVALEQHLNWLGDSTSLVELNVPGASIHEVDVEARRFGTVMGTREKNQEVGRFLVKMQTIAEAEKLVQLRRAFQGQRVEARFRPLAEWEALVVARD